MKFPLKQLAGPIKAKFAKKGKKSILNDGGLSLKELKLGILGGGQLARMMLPHCLNWDIPVAVLDGESSVCREFCRDFRLGDFRSEEDVLRLSDCSHVTLDLEAVNLQGLRQLEERGVMVSPSSKVIEIIQNKVKQKNFFSRYNFPTAPYKVVEEVTEELEAGFLKIPEGGYDGRGVHAFDGKLSSLPESFKKNILWEERANIDLEISVLVARSSTGQIKVYEPTEMAFDEDLNLISYTLYPARIAPLLAAKAKELAVQITEALEMVGILAVEIFLTKEGKIWINELAPRPHNSGHHSIESCLSGQFENHLRAVLQLPLGDTELLRKALTFNILGEENGPSHWIGNEELLARDGVSIHNYGKRECRVGRKMGHVTLLGNSYDELIAKYHLLHDKIKVKKIRI